MGRVSRIFEVAAVAAVAALPGCGGGGEQGLPGPPPAPGPAPALERPVELGGSPAAVASGLGGVWIADNLRARVLRVDPATGEVTDRVRTGRAPVAIAVGEGAVWVAGADGAVQRIDPETLAVEPAARVPGAAGIAAGEGSVWVSSQSRSTVTRLDPATGEARGRPIGVGGGPTDVAVGGGAVWVANSRQMEGTVSRIEPGSGEAGEPIDVADGQTFALTYSAGGVWVAASDDERADRIDVVRIDPESSEVEGDGVRLGRPGLPVRLAAGDDAVWVAQAAGAALGAGAASGTIARLDPVERRRVGAPASLPGPPAGVSVGEGSVWVAIAGEGALVEVGP